MHPAHRFPQGDEGGIMDDHTGRVGDELHAEALSLEALLLARGYLYELFHKALGGDPTSELVAALTSAETLDVVDEYAEAGETMAKLRAFLAELAGRTADEGARVAFVSQAKDEYTRLFVGPNSLPAQPMESPHVTHEFALFQENTVAVRRIYAARGLEPVRLNHVPDDHVSLMCDFMARIAFETLAAFRVDDMQALRALASEQGTFAAAHMANWLPEFARLQSRTANPLLYPQLSAALAEFVRLDVAFLAELMAWIDGRSDKECVAENECGRPESFARVEAAFGHVRALRLFGLEDCELRELADS